MSRSTAWKAWLKAGCIGGSFLLGCTAVELCAGDLWDKVKQPFTGKNDAAAQTSPNKDGTKKVSKASEAEQRVQSARFASEFAKGQLHERSGDWAKARNAYEALVKEFPHEPSAFHRLGVVADQQRRHSEAQQLFTEALRMKPRDAELFNDLGFCFYLQGKLDKAESALAKAVQLDAKNARYRNNLGLVLGQKGQYQEAFREFSQVGSEADAYYNLAFVYTSQEKIDQAKGCFQRALAVDPKHDLSRKALDSFQVFDASPPSQREATLANDGRRWVPYQESSDVGNLASGAGSYPVQQASHASSGNTASPNRSAAGAAREAHNSARGLMDRNMASRREGK